jgi:hypothetical protein
LGHEEMNAQMIRRSPLFFAFVAHNRDNGVAFKSMPANTMLSMQQEAAAIVKNLACARKDCTFFWQRYVVS